MTPNETAPQSPTTPAYRSYRTLGVRVDGVQIPQVIEIMRSWIADPDRSDQPVRYVSVTGMHGVTEAQDDGRLLEILNSSDLVVPDGMPLVWLARRRGIPLERRVYGPELMETFCSETGGEFRHYLFGGAPGVAERLASVMERRFDNNVVGFFCPPFRPASPEEDRAIVERINAARPDIVWVGLSTPKQERWMFEHRHTLDAPVSVGVGAAFDFLTESKPSAPAWMQENGLEWLFRLSREPRRLWRRYLLGGSRFLARVVREELRSNPRARKGQNGN